MRVRKRVVLFRILTLLCILLIWVQSVLPREISSGESGFFLNLLTPLLEHFAGEGNVTDHLVRKMAHFIEYACLGGIMAHYAAFSLELNVAPVIRLVTKGWFIAFIDETIQIFSGRGPAISDVWLDLSGEITAFIIFFAVRAAVLHSRKKRE